MSVEHLLCAYNVLVPGDIAENKIAKMPHRAYVLVMGDSVNKANQ